MNLSALKTPLAQLKQLLTRKRRKSNLGSTNPDLRVESLEERLPLATFTLSGGEITVDLDANEVLTVQGNGEFSSNQSISDPNDVLDGSNTLKAAFTNADLTFEESGPTTLVFAGADLGGDIDIQFDGGDFVQFTGTNEFKSLDIDDARLISVKGTIETQDEQIYGGPVALIGDATFTSTTNANINFENALKGSPLVITEVMANPDSSEPEWEWVEIHNRSTSTIDFSETPFTFFDAQGNPDLTGPNITNGSIAPGGTAVLFNDAEINQADFLNAWGAGINAIGVSTWPQFVNNGGDTLGLWSNFESYDVDNNGDFDNALVEANYGNVTSGTEVSAYLDPADVPDITEGNIFGTPLWKASVDSVDGAFDSEVASDTDPSGGTDDNTGNDIGSPGFIPQMFTPTSYNAIINGNAIFDDFVLALTSLTVNGNTVINNNEVQAFGNQTYNGNVLLNNDATFSGDDVSFNGDVNSDDSQANNLTVNADLNLNGNLGTGTNQELGTVTVNGDIVLDGNTTIAGDTLSLAANKGIRGQGNDLTLKIEPVNKFAYQDLTNPATSPFTFNPGNNVVFDNINNLQIETATINLGGIEVETGGTQTYIGAVTIPDLGPSQSFDFEGTQVTLEDSDITFDGFGATFEADVQIKGSVNFTNGEEILFTKNVVVESDATLSLFNLKTILDFEKTISGAGSLVASGFVLTLAGNNTISVASQEYKTNVELQGNPNDDYTFTGTSVVFEKNTGILNSGFDLGDLEIDFNDGFDFGIGALTLNSSGGDVVILDLNGGTLDNLTLGNNDTANEVGLLTNISTSGNQTYNAEIKLLDPDLNGFVDLTGDEITFNESIDGNEVALGVLANSALTIGDAQTDEASGLDSLTVLGDTTINAGLVSTLGTGGGDNKQDYTGGITLGSDVELEGSELIIDMDNGIDGGGNDLTLSFSEEMNLGWSADTNFTENTGTEVIFSNVDNLTVGTGEGGVTSLVTNITTSSGQTYNDQVNFTVDRTLQSTGDGDITLGDVNGTGTTLNINTGDANDPSIGITKLTGLMLLDEIVTDAGGSTQISTDIAIATQTYNDDVEIHENVTLSGADLTFNGNIDGNENGGAKNLTIDATNSVILGNETSDKLTGVGTLNFSGSNTPITANLGLIETSGDQSYDGNLILGGTTPGDITELTGGGDITFATGRGIFGTNASSESFGLKLDFDNTSTTLTVESENIAFNPTGTFSLSSGDPNDVVVSNLDSLNVDNQIIAGNITTNESQIYNEKVTLIDDANLTVNNPGANICFLGGIDGGGFDLETTTNDGATTFGDDDVSDFTDAVTNLVLLTVNGDTRINTDITTTGTQDYNGDVFLGIDCDGNELASVEVELTTSSAEIFFDGTTVDGSMNGDHLILNVSEVDFDVTVENLAQLTVNGIATINTANITTAAESGFDGSQLYQGTVTLETTTELEASTVTFESTVDSNTGAEGLTVTGDAEFEDSVGSSQPLDFLTVTGNTTFGDAAAISIDTVNNQTYGDDASADTTTLVQDTTLDSTSGIVTFNSTVDGTTADTESLNIEAPEVNFNGNVGSTVQLKDLTVDDSTGATTINLNAAEFKAVTQTYGDSPSADQVNLLQNATFYGDEVTFKAKVDGGFELTSEAGLMTFQGNVGLSTQLTEIDVNNDVTFDATADGDITLKAVTQTYGSDDSDQALVDEDAFFEGTNLTFHAKLDSVGNFVSDRVISNTSNTTINADVGTTLMLFDLIINSQLTTLDASVIDAELQVYGDNAATDKVTIEQDITLRASERGVLGIQFDSTLDSSSGNNFDLTVENTGGSIYNNPVEFNGTVGGTDPLDQLTVNGSTTIGTDKITTAGDQTYGDTAGSGTLDILQSTELASDTAITVNNHVSVNGNDITFATPTTNVNGDILDGGMILFGTMANPNNVVVGGSSVTIAGTEIDFSGAIDGNGSGEDLTVSITGGTANFAKSIGTGTKLGTFSTSGSGTAVFNGDTVATTGNQSYGSNVTFLQETTNLQTDSATVSFDSGTVEINEPVDREAGDDLKVGTVNVTGDLTLQSGATVNFDITGNKENDQFTADGLISINGPQFDLFFDIKYVPFEDDTYTLFDAADTNDLTSFNFSAGDNPNINPGNSTFFLSVPELAGRPAIEASFNAEIIDDILQLGFLRRIVFVTIPPNETPERNVPQISVPTPLPPEVPELNIIEPGLNRGGTLDLDKTQISLWVYEINRSGEDQGLSEAQIEEKIAQGEFLEIIDPDNTVPLRDLPQTLKQLYEEAPGLFVVRLKILAPQTQENGDEKPSASEEQRVRLDRRFELSVTLANRDRLFDRELNTPQKILEYARQANQLIRAGTAWALPPGLDAMWSAANLFEVWVSLEPSEKQSPEAPVEVPAAEQSNQLSLSEDAGTDGSALAWAASAALAGQMTQLMNLRRRDEVDYEGRLEQLLSDQENS